MKDEAGPMGCQLEVTLFGQLFKSAVGVYLADVGQRPVGQVVVS